MKFIVMEIDDDLTRPVAMYEDRTLAEKHSEWIGGWIEEMAVSTELPSGVDDPVEVARRVAEAARKREQYQQEQARQQHAHEQMLAYTVDDCLGTSKLCTCCTFSAADDVFRTPNGYCLYCGGFTMETIRGKYGDEVLQRKIDEEALHTRKELRAILEGKRKPGLQLSPTCFVIPVGEVLDLPDGPDQEIQSGDKP